MPAGRFVVGKKFVDENFCGLSVILGSGSSKFTFLRKRFRLYVRESYVKNVKNASVVMCKVRKGSGTRLLCCRWFKG